MFPPRASPAGKHEDGGANRTGMQCTFHDSPVRVEGCPEEGVRPPRSPRAVPSITFQLGGRAGPRPSFIPLGQVVEETGSSAVPIAYRAPATKVGHDRLPRRPSAKRLAQARPRPSPTWTVPRPVSQALSTTQLAARAGQCLPLPAPSALLRHCRPLPPCCKACQQQAAAQRAGSPTS